MKQQRTIGRERWKEERGRFLNAHTPSSLCGLAPSSALQLKSEREMVGSEQTSLARQDVNKHWLLDLYRTLAYMDESMAKLQYSHCLWVELIPFLREGVTTSEWAAHITHVFVCMCCGMLSQKCKRNWMGCWFPTRKHQRGFTPHNTIKSK